MDNNIVNNLIKGYDCTEIKAFDFYRDVFPIGSFERKGVYEDNKANGIIIEVTSEKKDNGKDLVIRHTLTDELDKIDEVCSRNNFCLMSPVGYIGKSRNIHKSFLIYIY